MKKNTETAKIPMINQVLKDAALGHQAAAQRHGLPLQRVKMVLDLLGMVGHVIAGDLKGVHSRVLRCLELVPANLKDFPQVLRLMILFCHGAVLLSGYRSMVSTR